MMNQMNESIFPKLCANDWIKFVISDTIDLETAYQKINEWENINHVNIAFSPVYNKIHIDYMISWIYSKNLHIILPNLFLNVQIHKIIGVK